MSDAIEKFAARFRTGYRPTAAEHARAALVLAAAYLLVPAAAAAVAATAPHGSPVQLCAAAAAVGWVLLAADLRGGLRVPLLPLWPSWAGRSLLGLRYEILSQGLDALLAQFLELAVAAGFKGYWYSTPQFDLYVISDPALVAHTLDKKFLRYEKGDRFHGIFADSLGDGIFNSDGDLWRQQRRTASHLFSGWQLENRMADVFGRHAAVLNKELRKHAGRTVDVQRLFFCFTFDTINEIAFGRAVSSLTGNVRDVEFQRCFDLMQQLVAQRLFKPDFVWRTMRALNVGAERQVREAIAVIRQYMRDVMAAREEEGAPGVVDLISMLQDQNERNANGGGKVYSDEEIIDFITNFLLAGRDTTAAQLTWAVYELAKPEHSAVRERLEAEFAAVDDPKEMHFAQAVFQETLRLWPSVCYDLKFCVEKDTLPDGTTVHPGQAVGYSPLLTSMRDDVFENPTVFSPERWMEPDGTCRRYDQKGHAYPAFNAGPRICLGRFMAAAEWKTALAAVMSEFRLDVVEGHVPRPMYNLVMMSRNGMPVTVTPRQ